MVGFTLIKKSKTHKIDPYGFLSLKKNSNKEIELTNKFFQ